MNTDSGRPYSIGEDLLKDNKMLGSLLPADYPEMVEQLKREVTEDEQAAAEDMQSGDSIVLVSPAVVQRLRLGDRELRRRKKRVR